MFKNIEFIFKYIFEFIGKLIKNKNKPQNIHIANISNRNPTISDNKKSVNDNVEK